MESLREYINVTMRDYFMEKVNRPLLKALIILGNRYPEATHDNITHPNSHRLVDMKDRYLQYDTHPRRRAAFGAAFRIGIAKYEHSQNYRSVIDFLIEELFKSNWKPRPYGHPKRDWNEPEPYGGG